MTLDVLPWKRSLNKASFQLNVGSSTNDSSHVENEISRYFVNIHAHLQCIEEQLRNDVSTAKYSNGGTLNDIRSELAINIRNLSGLLSAAKSVLYTSTGTMKLNIQVITERLENCLNIPCYLIGHHQDMESLRFEHDNLLENLKDNFSINVGTADPCQLVCEDSLPDNYDTTLPDAIALMSIEDISRMIYSPAVTEQSLAVIPSSLGTPKFSLFMQNEVALLNFRSILNCDLIQGVPVTLDFCVKFATLCVSSGDCLTNALLPKSAEDSSSSSTTIERWVQSTSYEMKESTAMLTLNIEDRENVIITHIDTPECFYVQLVRLNKSLYNLAREINQHVQQFAPVVKNPELNKLYIVKYEVKHSKPEWYRGRVIDILRSPNGQQLQYCIQYIDYGNTSIVGSNMLREISTSLSKPKPFALQCKLMNVYPVASEWDSSAMKLMAQILTNTDVLMVVMNNSEGLLEVDLIAISNGASVRDALIFVGYAVPCINSSTSLTELALKTSKPLPKLHKRTERFSKEQTVDIFISHVIDPHNVYIQLADFLHHINNLSAVMSTYYYNNKPIKPHASASKNENIYVPKKDMIVAVRCGDNTTSLWYRGVVTNKHDGEGMVEIFLVDIGKSVTVSYTNIRKLAERFRNLECQAILVKMVHINPPNGEDTWDETSKDFLNKYILKQQKVQMRVYDPLSKVPEVLLFEHYPTVDICINAVMVKEQIAQFAPNASLQIEWIQQEPTAKSEVPFVFSLLDTIQSTKKTNKENNDSDDEVENSNIIRKPINVLATKNPDLIYVAIDDEDSKRSLHKLQLDLQNYYSRHHTSSSSQGWNENDPCVVFNKQSKMYFRAIILHKIELNKFQVLLRDTAEELTIHSEDILVLENQFKSEFEGAIRCHMGGISPAGDPNKWSLMAIEFLQKMFQREPHIFMSKNGPLDKDRKSLSVEMWFSEFKPGAALEPSKTVFHSINKMLIKNGLALKQRGPSASTKLPFKSLDNEPEFRKKEPQSKFSKTKGKKYIKPTKDASNIKSITVPTESPKFKKELNHFSNANFLHSVLDNIPPQYSILERPKSAESNAFTAAIDQGLSLSTGCSPTHNIFNPLIEEPKYTSPVNDWNELIKIHEATENNLEDTQITDWLKPRPFTKKMFYAYATFVDDNANIYLHDIEYERGLNEMEAKMKIVFDALPSEPKGTLWIPGQICTVKYFINQSWYRGKIIEVNDEHIKVFMVDYGNIEECKHEDLRMKIMYANLPAFANKVKLYKIFPKNGEKWLTSDLDELHKNVVEKKLLVMLQGNIKSNDVNYSAIVKVDDITINEWMLQKSANLAPFRVKQSVIQDTADVIVEEEHSDDPSSVAQPSTSPSFLSATDTVYTLKVISESLVGQKVPVGIVNILNFDKFIIEFIHDANTEAKDLFERISDDIKGRASQQPVLFDLQLGQACVTQFSEDGEWYRGQVYNLDNIKHGVVEIWFVDFGNFENVPRESVRAVHPDWLQLPIQQYMAHVHQIGLNDESNIEEVLKQLSQYCNTIQTAEIMSTEPLFVQLYDDSNELLYKDLIEQNIIHYRK